MELGHFLTRSGLTYLKSFPWDSPVAKISPELVRGPEQGKSSGRIATFSLWTGMFREMFELQSTAM